MGKLYFIFAHDLKLKEDKTPWGLDLRFGPWLDNIYFDRHDKTKTWIFYPIFRQYFQCYPPFMDNVFRM